MVEKPELIVFAENKIGGVQSYYHNLLSNDESSDFDKLWILTDSLATKDARLPELFNCCREIVFKYQPDSFYSIADKLQSLVSNRPGVIMTNHKLELAFLHKYRRNRKTIFFICHDELYLDNALKFEFLIDVFVAHNPYFFEELKRQLPPNRTMDVYYLPYGIKPSSVIRKANDNQKIKLLFIARLTEKKGIFDLRKIDDHLIKSGISVVWTIIGDGPDRNKLIEDLKGRDNFRLLTLSGPEEILLEASKHDVFILPSYLDGLPVALLEAMSAGLVPIVSRFNPGIDYVMKAGTGFIVPVGDIAAFSEKIAYLNFHRSELEERSHLSRTLVLNDYEVRDRARAYYDLFTRFRKLKRPVVFRRAIKEGGWDYPWIPGFVHKLYRNYLFYGIRNRIVSVSSVWERIGR